MQVLVYSLKLDKAEPVLLDSSTHPTELNLYIQVCDSSTSQFVKIHNLNILFLAIITSWGNYIFPP
jgi:hypothetical protein